MTASILKILVLYYFRLFRFCQMFLQFFYIFPRPQRLRSLGQQQGISQIVFLQVRARRTVDRAGKLQRLIDLRYRRYPNFCETMHTRAERYNACREELFRLEKEGKVLLIAPESTQGFSRVERDLDQIRALWKDGYDQGLARSEEIRAFWGK